MSLPSLVWKPYLFANMHNTNFLSLVAPLTEESEVSGSIPGLADKLSWKLIMKNFSTAIFSFPLIQEGQLSVWPNGY